MKSILALDLATTTGWAALSNNNLTSGTLSFKGGRFEGGGMRFLRFQKWLEEILTITKIDVVFYEEVRHHIGVDAAHVHGGLLAVMQTVLEQRKIPYQGIPVGTIKKRATGKGNANKEAMVTFAKAMWPEQNVMGDDQADALWILQTGKDSLNE